MQRERGVIILRVCWACCLLVGRSFGVERPPGLQFGLEHVWPNRWPSSIKLCELCELGKAQAMTTGHPSDQCRSGHWDWHCWAPGPIECLHRLHLCFPPNPLLPLMSKVLTSAQSLLNSHSLRKLCSVASSSASWAGVIHSHSVKQTRSSVLLGSLFFFW